ncbi:MAG: DUF3380 domain-containing protein [Caldilinea sp.]|nr:DUF3380 domain-containing protein [Caldilinea sp.]
MASQKSDTDPKPRRTRKRTPKPPPPAEDMPAGDVPVAEAAVALDTAAPASPAWFPPYIYGLHEAGGEQLMIDAGRLGWVLELASVGLDGGGGTNADFTRLSGRGLGVVVRMHNGYEPAGSIPKPERYDDFARSCAAFVARSQGCKTWIIGNEPNHGAERPDGQFIFPKQYADCYRRCRTAIHQVPGHADDLVLVAGPAPWNAETRYDGNPGGDWAKYFADILAELPAGGCDGFAIHTYTRFLDASRIRADFPFNADGYRHLHDEFRSYRDFMAAISDRFKGLPVLITETDPTDPNRGWEDGRNIGWVREAFEEIADWNANPAHQPIQALVLYRWPPREVHHQAQWSIADRPGIIEDFRQALQLQPAERFHAPAPRAGLASLPDRPPVHDHQLARIPRIYTNQQAINALHDAALALGEAAWALLERGGLDLPQLAAQRESLYGGTPLEELAGLTAGERAAVRGRLIEEVRSGRQWHGLVNAPDGLNLRTAPGTDSTVIVTLAHETSLDVLLDAGDWLYVLAGPDDGYVFAAHVLRTVAVSTEPAPGSDDGLDLALPAAEQVVEMADASDAERRLIRTWNSFGGLLKRLSERLGIDPGVALAVLLAESAGEPFAADGRMIIRFEVHIFDGEWQPADPSQFDRHFRYNRESVVQDHAWRPSPDAPWRPFHGNQAAEWEVFTFARSLDETAAMRSISMGAPQVMGFNHLAIDYPSVQAMFAAFQASARAQIEGLFRFVQGRFLLPAIQRGDFLAFAAGYNGPGNAEAYAGIIRSRLASYQAIVATPAAAPPPIIEAADSQEDEMAEAVQNIVVAEPQALPAPAPPVGPGGKPLAEVDPELYDAWRKHVERGFENNNRMFDRTLNAYMYPYWLTVGMYVLLFLVGISAFIVAARLSFEAGKEVYTLIFGGVGVTAFLTFFLTRPLQALEENLQFITWLGMIYNTYWTRLAYMTDQETVQTELEDATNESIKKIKDLLDTHSERSGNRPGLR